MHIQLTFKAAMQVLADLAGSDMPPHVRVKAACKLSDHLSPANPRQADIMRELSDEPAKDIPARARTITNGHEEPMPHPYALLAEMEEEPDEDDPTENGQDDDEPP